LVEPLEYALVIGQSEPVVIAGLVVMALVIGQPKLVEMAGEVVMTLVVVVMEGSVEYALVLPPPVVVVVMAGLVEMAESVEYAQVLPSCCCGGGDEV
jgi:hypothetical protein